MLHFDQLKIHNFGPFKGDQIIDFTENNGVTIIWGSNGRGKTTLLNVFRYALFGKVKGRRGEYVDYLSLSNIEAKGNGEYGFSVVLNMTNEIDKYTLTRAVRLRDGISLPSNNEDFIEDCFLKKNGNILSVAEREHELAQIMPADISRFFLFDGELLQEYETLLDDESNDGALIKSSIEKILGLPILTNASKDIADLVSWYITTKNSAAKNDENTVKYANAITTLLAEISGHTAEMKRLQGLLDAEQAKISDIKKQMDKTERLRILLAQESSLEQSINRQINQRDSLITEIQAGMKTCWQGMVSPTVGLLIEQIRQEIEKYGKKQTEARVSQAILRQIEYAVKMRHCEVCDQDVNEHLVEVLQVKLDNLRNTIPSLSGEEKRKLSTLNTQMHALQSLELNGNMASITSIVNQKNSIGIAISNDEQQLQETRKEIKTYGDYDPSMVTLGIDYANCQAKIKELKDGIAKEKKAKEHSCNKQK